MLKRFTVFPAILILAAAIVAAQGPIEEEEAVPEILVVTGANLIDGVSDEIRSNATIVIEGGEIVDIRSDLPPDLPGDAFVLHLPGHWVMPGLIDAHVHVSHDTREFTEKRLEIALLGGVTAVRDMGGDARRLASLARDALLGEIPSPNIYYSSVFAGPTFFDDPRAVDVTRGSVPGHNAWTRAVEPETDLRKAVDEARGAGATGVKIYTNLSAEDIARTTAAAHAGGLLVWSHVTVFPSRPSDAVSAGVDVISHGSMLQFQITEEVPSAYGPHRDFGPPEPGNADSPILDDLFLSMIEANTILDPTLFVTNEMAEQGPEEERVSMKARHEFSCAATKRAQEAGVKIAAGTDSMVDEGAEFPNIHEELRLLVECAGFTPSEAIKAVTSVGAETIGAEDRTGSIAIGKQADLVVLAADPTIDIKNSTSIRFVIKDGRLHARQ
jgi:imidazolonepropionase-like amidohydrolase